MSKIKCGRYINRTIEIYAITEKTSLQMMY